MAKRNLASRILRTSFGLYFIIAVSLTALQLFWEYRYYGEDLQNELAQVERSFSRVISKAVWEFDAEQLSSSLEGVMQSKSIVGVSVNGLDGKRMAEAGKLPSDELDGGHFLSGYDLYIFDLKYSDGSGDKKVAEATFYIPVNAVYKRFEHTFYITVFNAILKTLALLIIFSIVLNKIVAKPLGVFTRAMEHLNPNNPSLGSGLDVDGPIAQSSTEMGVFVHTFEEMRKSINHKNRELEAYSNELEQKIAERTDELTSVHRELMTSAHQAGMAEIATGVLHNIGNVLTSVVIGVDMTKQLIRSRTIDQVCKISDLLKDEDNIQEFLATEKGAQVLVFFTRVGEVLLKDQKESLSNIKKIEESLTLMRDSISNQQQYAKGTVTHESVNVAKEVDLVLKLQKQVLESSRVQVDHQSQPDLLVNAQRTHLSHILVNIIKNGIEAMEGVAHKRMVISYLRSESGVEIRVCDNGVGIQKDKVDSLFTFGFTTKEGGHGFGLHHSANTMQDMGGSLRVESEGLGTGATFVLFLPTIGEKLQA